MKILFLAPHSAIWEHAFPEALVASALKSKGNEILYITCGEVFRTYCASMSSKHLRFDASQEERAQVCRLCKANKNLIKERFGFNGYDLGDVLTENDRAEIRELLTSVTRENFFSFTYDGVPVGRTSLYEVILNYKKSSLDFSKSEWSHYLVALGNSMLSLRAGQRILDKERPDAISIHSSVLAVNHVWRHLAEQRGIIPYLLQGGFNHAKLHSQILVAVDRTEKGIPVYAQTIKYWDCFKDYPIIQETTIPVVRHFEKLFSGRDRVYSAPRRGVNVRECFGVPKDVKILTATMSSFDEILAADAVGFRQLPEDPLFSSQPEWIERLFDYIRGRDDLFLIVRVHPREFPRKGGSQVLSENAKALQEKLKNIPSNARVNWPTDELSMYDIAEETDVVLNGISSVGAEMPLLGIPVVAYMSVDWFPPGLNYMGTTEVDYFGKIEQALQDGWQPELIRMAFRWFSLLFSWATFDLSESFKRHEAGIRSPFRRLLSDPIWFLESVRERLGGRRNSRIPLGTQKHFIRYAKISPEMAEEVHRIFSDRLGSALDLRKTKALNGPIDQEDLWLRRGIGTIVSAMIRSGRAESPLVTRLKNFSQGERL